MTKGFVASCLRSAGDRRFLSAILGVICFFLGAAVMGSKGALVTEGLDEVERTRVKKQKKKLRMRPVRLALLPRKRAKVSPFRLKPLRSPLGRMSLRPELPQGWQSKGVVLWEKGHGYCWDLSGRRDRMGGWCAGSVKMFHAPLDLVSHRTYFRGELMNTSVRLEY